MVTLFEYAAEVWPDARPLSTHEVEGVSGRSLTEVDFRSWPKEKPPATQDPPKIH